MWICKYIVLIVYMFLIKRILHHLYIIQQSNACINYEKYYPKQNFKFHVILFFKIRHREFMFIIFLIQEYYYYMLAAS